MTEFARVAKVRQDQLAQDLITFTGIMEDTARTAGEATSWRHPAQSAAEGLDAGWNALMSPADRLHQMPELHRRVTTYLGKMGVKEEAKLQPSFESLTLAAPDVLLAIYGRLPKQHRRNGFVEEVIRDAKKLRSDLPAEARKERKKIIKGLNWVLSVPAAFSR